MATEIERKFLVNDAGWRRQAGEGMRLRQGYLAGGKDSSIRVRSGGGMAHLNIKSATLGVSRREYDYPIPMSDAEELLNHLCERPLIEKTRYHVEHAGHTWEVDIFEGDNAGLVVAEIELQREDEVFARPPWLGAEVSHDPRYYNVSLVRHPYKEWKD
jgi:adenylate cyclase